MTSSSEDEKAPEATSVRFDDAKMWVNLNDGRVLGVPLTWFPRLLHGEPALREKCWITPSGIHWDELDEDISIAGLIAGKADQSGMGRHAA